MKIILFIIYLLVIFIAILLYQIKKNKSKFMWAIIILRICLPIVSIGFFGQIFLFLCTLFDCQNGHSYISEELKCRTGDWFIYHLPFVVVAMPLHFILALITNTLYYRSLFIRSQSDVLKKTNSIPDICLLCTKVIIILLFTLDKQEESEHWAIIFLLMILTGFNSYTIIYYKNRLNMLLMLLNTIFSLLLFFGFFTLFIGKIFKFLGYNGSIFFYILIIVIIFLFIIFIKNKEMDFISLNYKNINNEDEYIYYILKCYRIILNKDNSRNYSTVLKSYIEAIERSCIDNHCAFKLYLEKLKYGIDCQYLLYEYLDKLFIYGISKFKNNAMLKNDYAMFLMVKMNNKKKAIMVLKSIQDENISFHRNYNIYRCRNLINKWPSSTNCFYFNYRNNISEFRKLILKTIKLYYEFWTLLYDNKFNKHNKVNKLYRLGTNIMQLNIRIEELFNIIIETKTNNIHIFNFYLEYLENILKNETKYQKYQNLKSTIYIKSFENEVNNYSNFNIENLKQNDNITFLLISARKKNLGIILDCPITVANIFGYTKEELIGKHINLLIPDIFHSKHNLLINNQSGNSNIDLFDNLFQKKEYNPSFIKRNIFGVIKSKFIIPLIIKIYYIKTEDNLISFVVEISKDITYMSELIKNNNINNIDRTCCVLTNENFLINEFTSNSIEQLGLSYRYMKSNNSIIPYIKQLNDDYKNMIYDLNINNHTRLNTKNELIHIDSHSSISEIETYTIKNISPEIKGKIKDDLINKKYNKKRKITWRINRKIEKNHKSEDNNDDNDIMNKCTRISNRGSNYNISIHKNDENKFEVDFIMEIKKAVLDNKLLGYYFYFSKLYPSKTKNFICYNVSEKNDYDKNGDLNNITKYKTIFKSSQKNLHAINQKKRKSCSEIIHYNNKKIIEKNKNIDNSFISKISKIKEDLRNKNKIIVDFINNYNDLSKGEKYTDDEIIIKDDFIPKCKINFSFDLNNNCYNLEKDYINSKVLNDVLYKESIKKIEEYHKYLRTLKNKEKESNITKSESEEDYTSNSYEDYDSDDLDKQFSSNNNSINKTNSINKQGKNFKKIQKSITLKHSIKFKIGKINPIKASHTLKMIKEVKEDNEKNNKKNKSGNIIRIDTKFSENMKKYQEKNYLNNYYKVNLSKIRFLIYDFHKDMVVEGNKSEINIKIENITINSKKQNKVINLGKDETYPFISFKVDKNEKNNENNKIENNNTLKNINQNNINEENILTRRINEAIMNPRNEESVKILNIYSIISCILMVIFSILILIISFYFYNRIKEIIKIIKDIISIKYCNTFSIYFLRELTLLNFNFSITGGVYNKFPGKDREKYISLIKSKFKDYFLETQSNIREILSSTFSPSKNIEKNISDTFINLQYDLSNKNCFIKEDTLATLLQYNGAFYNLAISYTPIYQNHSDMFNFMHNSFNNYTKAINILLNNYNLQLKEDNQKIFIIIIIFAIITLLFFIFFCFLIIVSFISATKERINYIQVFYGINLNSIKNLMFDCEKFMNKIKGFENENNEEDLEEEFKIKKSIFQNKNINQNSSKNIALNNNDEKKSNNIRLTLNSKILIFFYIICMIIQYIYIPYNCLYLYNVSKQSFEHYEFFENLNTFHSNILNQFNIYREYLFDNKTNIHDTTPFEYLHQLEIYSYDTILIQINYLEDFIDKNIKMNDEFIDLKSKGLCSFYITDYFNSNEECINKYSYLMRYDFKIFSTYFLQNIRNVKNIAKFNFETDNIVGELAMDIDNNLEKIKELEQSGEKYVFRLELFNNETLHLEMNIFYINILLPYIDKLRKIILKNISIEGKQNKVLILFYLYLILIFLIYFAYLFPMIKFLNNSIYKTKKILLLIPMKILVSQINIKSLLKLE